MTQQTQSPLVYEAPTFTLTPDAQRELQRLKDGQQLRKLTASLQQARENIQTTASDINECLADQERTEKRRKERAAATGQDVPDDAIQQRINFLRDQVERMTQRMDESMRKIIDGQEGLRHIHNSIDAAAAHATEVATTQATQQSRQPTRKKTTHGDEEAEEEEDEGEQDDELQAFEPTAPGTQDHISAYNNFKKQLDDAKTRYQSASLTTRYAENDSYRDFRSLVHDARHGDEDGHPLAHPSEWFNEEGAPAPGVTRAGGDEDSDDDIAVSRATISTKCPLTLQEFRTPLTSKKCPHSFEKEAIAEMIRYSATRVGGREGPRGGMIGGEKAVMCPVPGCGETLTADDLHVDPVLKRKIQRLQRAKEMMDAEDDEDEAEDGSGATQRNATVLDDGSDDDDDDDEAANVVRATQTKMKKERVTGNPPPRSTARSAVVDLDDTSDEDTVMFNT